MKGGNSGYMAMKKHSVQVENTSRSPIRIGNDNLRNREGAMSVALGQVAGFGAPSSVNTSNVLNQGFASGRRGGKKGKKIGNYRTNRGSNFRSPIKRDTLASVYKQALPKPLLSGLSILNKGGKRNRQMP